MVKLCYHRLVLIFELLKGGEVMMAMFFAQRVILERIAYSKVPSKLKPQVKEILIECGCEFLIDEKEDKSI